MLLGGRDVQGLALRQPTSSSICTASSASSRLIPLHPAYSSVHLLSYPLQGLESRKAMRAFKRGYATVGQAPSRLRLRGKTPLDLDHFLQRQRALALWRDILRSTASISDVATRNDMRQFARAEFEQHRDVTDLGHIRYLISVRLFARSVRGKVLMGYIARKDAVRYHEELLVQFWHPILRDSCRDAPARVYGGEQQHTICSLPRTVCDPDATGTESI